MHVLVFQRILAKLNGDAALLALLGVTTLDPANPPIFKAQRLVPVKAPSVTLDSGNPSQSSFPGSNAAIDTPGAFVSSNNPTLQIDVWVSSEGGISPDNLPYPQTGEDTDAIVDRINVLLVQDTKNRVSGTHGWSGVSSAPTRYEVETGLFHNVSRYQFEYFIKSGFVPV
jgi:hypothetical protein